MSSVIKVTIVVLILGCLATIPTWGQMRYFDIRSNPSTPQTTPNRVSPQANQTSGVLTSPATPTLPTQPTQDKQCTTEDYTISSVELFGDYESISDKNGTVEIDAAGAPVIRSGIAWDQVDFLANPGLFNPFASNPSQPLARCGVRLECGAGGTLKAYAISELICGQLVKHLEMKKPIKVGNVKTVAISQPGVKTNKSLNALFIWYLKLN